jgi:nucleoid-associated protein YgaU
MAIALDPRYVAELRPGRSVALTGTPASRRRPMHRVDVVYRRRRLAAVALVVSLALASAAGARAMLPDAPTGPSGRAIVPSAQAPSSYLVRPGDTMWAVAVRFSGDGSVRSYVDDLIRLNGGASIQVGQRLLLP